MSTAVRCALFRSQENLVKLLFATETFAMGLNMPARTVTPSDLKPEPRLTRILTLTPNPNPLYP